MTNISKSAKELSPEKRALLAKRLRSTENTQQLSALEPIAITGMACRLPGGANSPETFWQHLKEGRDAIIEVPPDRWDANAFYSSDPLAPGKMLTRAGGFLDEVDLFDAHFFSIAPREAERMDPQQRLFLEVAWEALENAGLAVDRLAGSKTGVFTAIYSSDYASLELNDMSRIDAYTATSTVHSVVPNRLSYLLDLQGPSLAIDTACSSSLVAIHLACQSLRSMECNLALVGGVNLLLSPVLGIAFSKWGMLSADGHCKTFDASANGYVRSEGCAVVVLKRLSDALSEQDPILGLVLGSAVNQDGRTTRLTAPSMQAQKEVIRQALSNAHVVPEQITYIETHGTGTSLGDPIEFEALSEVMGQSDRPDKPCVLGAVKTNIGHLETVSGMASLIKIIMSMRHDEIPANLHFQHLNPHITLEHTPFVIPSSDYAWPATTTERRYAGLSAFGAGGTNAHLVLCDALRFAPSQPSEQEATKRPAYLLPLSARSPKALSALVRRYHQLLSSPENALVSLYNLCYSASLRRSHHQYRLAVIGQSRQELVDRLAAFLRSETHAGLVVNPQSLERTRGSVFVFPGQGSQWIGMGKQLFEQEPIFRDMLLRCEQAFQPHVDWSLQSLLTDDKQADQLKEIDSVQPVLFAMQVSLAALWRSWGIEPVAVVGHSMGEVAAAYVAGILSLEDAACIICRRSRLLRRTRGHGAMLAVGLSLEQASVALDGYTDRVSVAVSNSPRSSVLSGDPEILSVLMEAFGRQNIFCNWVKVDVASHSPQMEPLRADLLAALQGIQPQKGNIPFYSTVTGQISEGYSLTAEYWVRNVREPVLFSSVIQQLLKDGQEVFLEISPHPILLPAIEQCLQYSEREGTLLPSLRRDDPEMATLLESLGALYTRGLLRDWRKLHPLVGRWVPLPAYPWQHQHFERPKQEAYEQRMQKQTLLGPGKLYNHPFLSGHLQSPVHTGMHFWELDVAPEKTPYLADHRVHETVLLPAMAYIEMALAAAQEIFGPGSHAVEQVTFGKMLLIDAEPTVAQLAITMDEAGKATFQFFSARKVGVDQHIVWDTHVTGKMYRGQDITSNPPPSISLQQIQERCPENVAGTEHYQFLRRIGQHYGPLFQTLERIWRHDGEALASVHLSQSIFADFSLYQVHPVLLDACFHVLLATLPQNAAGHAYVPVFLQSVHIYVCPSEHDRLWWYGKLHSGGEPGTDTIVGDMYLVNEQGQVLLAVSGATGKQLLAADEPLLKHTRENLGDWFYKHVWVPTDALAARNLESGQSGNWLLFSDKTGTGTRLQSLLEAYGVHCICIAVGEIYSVGEPGHYVVNPASATDMPRLFKDLARVGQLDYHNIVYLWSLDTQLTPETTSESLESAQDLSCIGVLHLVQALNQIALSAYPRLWLVTRNAQRVGFEDIEVQQAPLWGLGRVIAQEHPELRCACIDISSIAEETESDAFYSELCANGREDQVTLRFAQRYVARLEKAHIVQTVQQTPLFHTDATYLITGGLGGIGLAVAQWLAERGARNLVLVGRHIPTEASSPATQILTELTAAGINIVPVQADVAQSEQVQAVLAEIQRTLPPLRGVFHAAGVLDDGILLQQNAQRFRHVMAAKMDGAWNLHTLTRALPLDFFVLFSSASSLLGSPGQGNYAAANAFMDALAHRRSAQGLPALSINWGPWGEVGLATRADREEYLVARGFEGMSSASALEALGLLLCQPLAQIGVLPIKWASFSKLFPVSSKSALLSTVLSAFQQEPEDEAQVEPLLLLRLKQVPPGKRRDFLRRYISDMIVSVLGNSEEYALNSRRGFFEMGMNSLMAVDLKNRLQADIGSAFGTIPTTVVFDHPTVEALGDYLASKVRIQDNLSQTTEDSVAAISLPQAENEKVAELLSMMKDMSSDALLRILNDQA